MEGVEIKKAVLFFAVSLFVCFSVFSQNVRDFEYSVNNGGITITGYKGSLKDIGTCNKFCVAAYTATRVWEA
ncbi:MAG: hypothetical protein LBE02_05680 [Spirochaetaceae bacterium]|nr:hypothetical protein [Spirochaetaceae bacterium]